MHATLYSRSEAQSQFDSAVSGGEEADSASPPILPQPADRVGEAPPLVIPTLDLRPSRLSSRPTHLLDMRVEDPELRAYDWHSEVTSLREEVANMATVANMARDEAQ